jgi:hypothetical protein
MTENKCSKFFSDFQQYLDFDVTLPVDKVQGIVDSVVKQLNAVTARLKKIFLVEDLVDSLKFAAGKRHFLGDTMD